MGKKSWRDIPLPEINWEVPLGRCRSANHLRASCRIPREGDGSSWNKQRWSGMTLGELADKGERWWQSYAAGGVNIGPKAVELIKLTIDMAASGKDVRMAIDRYIPACERDSND